MFACWHSHLYRWRPTIIMNEVWRIKWGILVSHKILIFSLFVGCFYHKGPALMSKSIFRYICNKTWEGIRIFESRKCDVNPQPNTRGIGPLVGRTSGNRRSVMHVLAVIFSITYHFFFICQYIFIQVILSDREIYPLLMYPSTFLVF